MKRPTLCLITAMVSLSISAPAAEAADQSKLNAIIAKRYSRAYRDCSGTTLELNFCAGAELDRQEKAMNRAFRRLVASDEALKDDPDATKNIADFRSAQRAWAEFRKKNCAALGLTGSMETEGGLDCQIDMTIARTIELESWGSSS